MVKTSKEKSSKGNASIPEVRPKDYSKPMSIPDMSFKDLCKYYFKEDKDFHQVLAIFGVEGRKIWTELENNLRTK